MGKLLTKGQIFSAAVPTMEVDIPEWDGIVRVRAMSVKMRARLLDVIVANERAIEDYRTNLLLPEDEREDLPEVKPLDQDVLSVIFCVVDEKNNMLFTMEDYDQVSELSMSSLRDVWSAHIELDRGKRVDPAALKKT